VHGSGLCTDSPLPPGCFQAPRCSGWVDIVLALPREGRAIYRGEAAWGRGRRSLPPPEARRTVWQGGGGIGVRCEG
jgi:hypothetical protein